MAESKKKKVDKVLDGDEKLPTKKKELEKTIDVKEAFRLLTGGRELVENNNSNAFGQLDRAWRQSRDETLKRRIATALGFSYKLHNTGARSIVR